VKNIVFIIGSIFILLGCSVKTQTDIDPYITLYQNEKQESSIDFLGVNDQRKSTIASTILNQKEIISEYPLNINVKDWYTQSLNREFENTNLLAKRSPSNMSVLVNIKSIDAQYKKYSLDTKNMQVKIQIEIVIKKGTVTKTSKIVTNQSVYKPIILDADGFKTILNESMRDSVSKIVAVVIENIKSE